MVAWKLNPVTGEHRRLPPEEDPLAVLRKQIAELEAEVRRWKFNAEHWESVAHQTQLNMGRHHAEDAEKLRQVSGLVNHRRKTLLMADLLRILQPDD